jgi:hypothetical protein
MKKLTITLLIAGSATWSSAIDPIPEASGFSGFASLGVAVNRVENNLIAGTDLGDISKERIDSVFDAPDDEAAVIPAVAGELRYTFGETGTQLYLGNTLEDWIRYDFASAIGVRQELLDKSIVEAGFLFSGIPTVVWADPYVEGVDREETDRTSTGGRISWYDIAGSAFSARYSLRKVEVDDEESGIFLGLSAAERMLLNREGDHHKVELYYTFEVADNQTLTPELTYVKLDLDGDAMSRDRYGIQLTHTLRKDRWTFVTNLGVGALEFREENPIYRKQADADRIGGSVAVAYRRLLDVNGLSLLSSILFFEEDSEIDFYDSQVVGANVSAIYGF